MLEFSPFVIDGSWDPKKDPLSWFFGCPVLSKGGNLLGGGGLPPPDQLGS